MKSKCRINEIRKKKKGGLHPLIIDFQNGDIVDGKMSELKVTLNPCDISSDNPIDVVCTNGQSFKSKKIQNIPFRQFIGVRNKKTKEMKLVEVDYTTLINSLLLKVEKQKIKETDTINQHSTLKKVFGTKKAVRLLQQRDTYAIDSSNVEDQVSEIVAESNVTSTSLIKKEDEDENFSDLIPPCNRNASVVEEVYRIEDIISREGLATLEEAVSEILESKTFGDKFTPYFKATYKEAVSKSQNVSERVAYLLYAEALINYIKIPVKALKSKMDAICVYSRAISQNVIDNFCLKTGSTLNRPLTIKDKVVCHVIILTLLACNYRFDLDMIAKQVAVGIPKMKQLCKVVGAVPSAKGSSIYVLKVPLPPPMKLIKQTRKQKG